MNYICLFLCSILLAACATTHPGKMSKSTNAENPIKLSVKVDDTLSDKYYLFLEYTAENTSADWVKMSPTAIGFEKNESEILVNDRLKSWIESRRLKIKQQEHNTGLILGSIIAVGGITGALSSNDGLRMAGAGAMIGAAGYATVKDIKKEQTYANSGQVRTLINGNVYVPESHILKPFQVAPGGFIRRWVVIKAPQNYEPVAFNSNANLISVFQQNEESVSYKTEGL